MTIQQINIGSSPKGEGGDTWRGGSEKLNANFQSLDERTTLAQQAADSKTANETDEFLLGRENHTGSQPIATIDGLQDALDSASATDIIAKAAIPSSQKGMANGVATLDSSGVIPANQLPSYVNAATATKLATPRKINGVGFDGTVDINLDVYNKSEVDTAIANAKPTIPDATETTAGKAKIATTAIARAGQNGTDFLTAKKLRDALNATGFAPVYACRAWVNFNGAPLSGTYSQSGTTVTVTMTAHGMSVGQNVNLTFTSGTAVSGSFTVTSIASANTFTITASTSLSTSGNVTRNLYIRASGNVSSVTDNGIGLYKVNFTTAMQDANYSAVANYNKANTAVMAENDGNASCSNYSTTSVDLAVMNGAAAALDAVCISVSIIR